MFVFRISEYKAYHAHFKIQMEPSWIYIPHVTHHVQYVSIGTCYVLSFVEGQVKYHHHNILFEFLKIREDTEKSFC